MGWRGIYRRESGSAPKVDSLCTEGMRDSDSPVEICIENDYQLIELTKYVNGVMTSFTTFVSWSVESPDVGLGALHDLSVERVYSFPCQWFQPPLADGDQG